MPNFSEGIQPKSFANIEATVPILKTAPPCQFCNSLDGSGLAMASEAGVYDFACCMKCLRAILQWAADNGAINTKKLTEPLHGQVKVNCSGCGAGYISAHVWGIGDNVFLCDPCHARWCDRIISEELERKARKNILV